MHVLYLVLIACISQPNCNIHNDNFSDLKQEKLSVRGKYE